MVERHWKGVALRDKSDQYIHHLMYETLPALKAIQGFKGLSILRKETGEGTTFLIITRWESLDAIQRFSGFDLTLAVVPDAVKSLMVTYDLRTEHYTVVTQSGS